MAFAAEKALKWIKKKKKKKRILIRDAYKPKSNIGMSQKQVMPKSEDLSRSLEMNAIWTFDTEFPTIFNKSCTYITFKSAVKHRQLGYGYPRGQTVHLAEATIQDTYSSI